MDNQHVKGKEKWVADDLSRKLHYVYELYYNHLECKFLDQVKEEAQKDPEYQFLWEEMEEAGKKGNNFEYGVNQEQMLTFRGKMYVPNCVDLKELIMNEYHWSNYAEHPGYHKMLTTIRKIYLWHGMRKKIAKYLNKCLECQQVKVEHQHPAGLLQPIPVPEWKWQVISLDFVMGLPRSKRHNDSIMV